ncbi:MAG: hypothetical protein ACOX6P_12050 [Candidatus Merdivicinus sp.]|jgi:hypothetical protein
MDDCLFYHHGPDGVVPFLQNVRLFFESADEKRHGFVLLTATDPEILQSFQFFSRKSTVNFF